MPSLLPSLHAAGLLALGTAAISASDLADAGRPLPVAPPGRMADLPPAVIDDGLAIGGEDIQARKVRTRMTVAVEVNGTGPYRFVVDSGADTSVVGRRLADALRLPAGSPVLLNGITASAYVDRVRVETLGVGPTSVYNLHLPVLKEGDLGAHGMLGLDALVEQRLMLDFEKRTIKVEDAARKAERMDGEIVVTARLQRGQLILTEVKAGQTKVDAVVDTGSEVTIGNEALRTKLFKRYPEKFETVEVTGVTGVTVPMQMVRIPRLSLGAVELYDIPIAFADVPPFKVFGIHEQPSLLLGTDLMEAFRRVSLDFRERKVRFQLKRCATSTVAIGTMVGSASRIRSSNLAVCSR